MFSRVDKFESRRQLIGEILVERNLVAQKDVDVAVSSQDGNTGYLGERLVSLGFVGDKDVVTALVIQNNFPYIAVDKYEIDDDVKALIPKNIARNNSVMPLNRVGSILSVVMYDPLDVDVKKRLQNITHCQITPFIATKEEINNAIDRGYGGDL